MATIKRSAKGARRTAKANARKNTARNARKKTGGFIDWLMGLLPFTEEQLQKIFLWLIIAGVLAAACHRDGHDELFPDLARLGCGCDGGDPAVFCDGGDGCATRFV